MQPERPDILVMPRPRRERGHHLPQQQQNLLGRVLLLMVCGQAKRLERIVARLERSTTPVPKRIVRHLDIAPSDSATDGD